MSKVSIRVNDRAFSIGCEPGQEAHVQKLGEAFDQKVAELAGQVGQIGDLRLFLMAALVLSDELASLRTDAGSDHSAQSEAKAIQRQAAKAVHDAADQVEQIVAQLSE
ncbi:MAG: cell division protein ZapA [Robiginitomaculum sp.]|nr:MAG: cell division protein ZapA [Robiginitomaculum sp.]